MSEITGVVQEVKSRVVGSGKTAYDIVVGGQSYGAGLFKPKCEVGDFVKFELDEARGYKNVGRNSLKVSKNKPTPEQMAESEKTAPVQSSTGGSFDQRQDTISRQAAMNTAIGFLTLAASQDALGIPASAKGKKIEVLEGMLHKYTQEFYEANTGAKWKDIGPKAEETPVEPPVEDAPAPVDQEWT